MQLRSGAWLTLLRPGWMPSCLAQFADEDWEAPPIHVDFEDLDRHMAAHGAVFEKRVSKGDAFQLLAHGRSAETLAQWLADAFAAAPIEHELSKPEGR